jgi:hypothetical protein
MVVLSSKTFWFAIEGNLDLQSIHGAFSLSQKSPCQKLLQMFKQNL